MKRNGDGECEPEGGTMNGNDVWETENPWVRGIETGNRNGGSGGKTLAAHL